MDTVKVDIRKLQILNDRINQTIDALSQLRQSVHGFQGLGLQHTSMGYPVQQQQPMVAFGPMGPVSPVTPQIPYMSPAQAYGTPWGVPTGLSHTTHPMAGAGWADPAIAFRIAQSFPFAFSPVAPAIQS